MPFEIIDQDHDMIISRCREFLDQKQIEDPTLRRDFLKQEIGFCRHVVCKLRAILATLPPGREETLLLWDIDGVIFQLKSSYVRPSFQVLIDIIRRKYPEVLYGLLTSSCPKGRMLPSQDLCSIRDIFDPKYCFSSESGYLFGPTIRNCSSCPNRCGEFYDEDALLDPKSRYQQDAHSMNTIDGYRKEVREVLINRPLGGILDKVAVVRFLLGIGRIPPNLPLVWIDDILSDEHINQLINARRIGDILSVPENLHFISNERYPPLNLPRLKKG